MGIMVMDGEMIGGRYDGRWLDDEWRSGACGLDWMGWDGTAYMR